MFLHLALLILLHFALMLLHFVATVITFWVSYYFASIITFCGVTRHICGDLKRKRKEIFQVPIEVNDEIIASL